MGSDTVFWLVVAAVAAITVAVLLMSDIRAEVSLKRERDNDGVRLSLVALYGLVRRQFDIPVLKWEGDGVKLKWQMEKGEGGSDATSGGGTAGGGAMAGGTDGGGTAGGQASPQADGASVHETKINKKKVKRGYRYFVRLLQATFELKQWMTATLRRVRCQDVVWVTQVGLGDAADSAVAAGVVWSVKAPVVGWVASSVRMMNEPRLAVVPLFNEWHFETVLQGKFRIRLAAALGAAIHLIWRILRIRGGAIRWWKVLANMRAKARKRRRKERMERMERVEDRG